MDQRLVAWARSVKARRHANMPPLWLFTDPDRPDGILPAAAGLPPGLCGIVLRHKAAPGHAALAKALARLCRARRIALSVAGDWRLAAALHASQHVRLARHERARRGPRLVTASAHNLREILAAKRAGAMLVFLSPVFPTATHPGARGLGVPRFVHIARRCPLPVLALGGMNGQAVRRLAGSTCAGAGAIRALQNTPAEPGLATRAAAAR